MEGFMSFPFLRFSITILRFSPAFGVMLLFSVASFAQITGRVIDPSGRPIANATVTYTNLAHRLIWTFSGADGRFSLDDPAKTVWGGNINWVGVKSTSIEQSAGDLRPIFADRLLYFNGSGRTSITISLYTLSGKLLSTRQLPVLGSGRYAVDPFANVKTRCGSNICLLLIKSGAEYSTLKIPFLSRSAGGASSPSVQRSALPKRIVSRLATTADGIRIGRTSFPPVFKPLTNPSQSLGDITLTPFNIEARVDSVIAAAADSPHVYLNQCLLHNEWDNPASSAEKSAGAHFMAGHVMPNVSNDPRLAASYAAYMDTYKTAHGNSLHRIPFLIGYDAVHGVNMCNNTVIFPHNIGLGATRDTQLVQVAYRVTAIEMAGTGCAWTFAPCIAVARNIGWGRTYESYGETPGLVSRMARAAVVGLQGFDLSHPLSVAACAKHFAGDGGTAKGTSSRDDAIYDRGNTNTGSEEVLRAIHLAPYKAAIEVGVASIMASFSKWNGVFMHSNAALLTDWLKTQNGFRGWICGDYDGHTQVNGGEEACMMAGLDMAMNAGTPPSKLDNVYTSMYNAGGDKRTRVLDAARRVLRMKTAMGLFDRPPETDQAVTALAGCQLHRDVARACVRESMVLLKNEGAVLPLKKSARIHLVGPHADNLGYQCGGWTLGWAEQNLTNENFIGATTIKAGFEKLAPGKISFAKDGYTIPSDADVVVVVFGEKVHAEWFGDSDNLGPEDWKILPGDASPVQLIDQAKKANKPVIGLLISSRPLIVSGYLNNLNALVCAWLPGSEGGGIAEVMYGDYDFKGTLPHTWPTSFSQEPLNTTAAEYGGDLGDLKGQSGTPQWPYGFGLSYKSGTLKAPF
jgi:beta-glucosidase